MAWFAAQTTDHPVAATTLITTDPVRIAEDYATLQHLTDGRMDLMLGRGNTGPCTRGSARTSARAWTGRRALRAAPPALARGGRQLAGPVPTPLPGLHLDAAPARRAAAVRVARLDRTPEIAEQAAYYGDGSSPTTSSGRPTTRSGWSGCTAERFEHYGHGRADQAIVGLGGQVFMRPNSQDAVREFGPTSTGAGLRRRPEPRVVQPRRR